jgi:predicted TIM-barrel fold metal-dependent hydrolase
MIIDCHCHAGTGDRLTAPWNTTAPLQAYLRRARAAGIDRTVVFAPFHSDYAIANAEVARIVRRSHGRLVGFAFVHPTRDAGRIDQMVRHAVQQWGFRGIKVHGSDALPNREVCDVARSLRLPVLVDVFGRAEAVEMFATQYPDVPFIIPHLGSFADDWRVHVRVIDQIARLPNVYTDTSGVKRFDYVVEAIRRGGARKVLFGSDGPWLHPGLELHKIRLLGLSPQDEALVLGGNILRLLRRAGTGAKQAPRPTPRQRKDRSLEFVASTGGSMPEVHDDELAVL